MNESAAITETSRRSFQKHFFGASPILRFLALFSALCLFTGWVVFALLASGVHRDSFLQVIVGTQLAAYGGGLSSYCLFGGIIAFLAALTLFGGPSCYFIFADWQLE